LLGEGPDDRKQWHEHRLKELAEIFAVAVGGFFRDGQSFAGARAS
jgi:hypothetical protein